MAQAVHVKKGDGCSVVMTGSSFRKHPRLAFDGAHLDDRLAVSSLHFFSGGMEEGVGGMVERILRVPGSEWFKDSNSLWDRIYDARGMGRYDAARRGQLGVGGTDRIPRGVLYHVAPSYFGTRVYITTDHYTIPVDEIDRFLDDH